MGSFDGLSDFLGLPPVAVPSRDSCIACSALVDVIVPADILYAWARSTARNF